MSESYVNNELSGFSFASGVPWVLIGATSEPSATHRDRVLARGGDVGTELVGFVREREFAGSADANAWSQDVVGWRARFGAVSSKGVPPSSRARDARYSTYTFAWEGRVRDADRIYDQFERSLPDVVEAIDAGVKEDVEWAIARLVFTVHENTVDASGRRTRLIRLLIFEVISLLILAVILILALR
jgi:hypothetical protein